MKKKSSPSGSAHSKAMIAATVITLPLVGLPPAMNAQVVTRQPVTQITTLRPLQLELMVKLSEKDVIQATIVGMDNGRPVYTNPRGEYFSLAPTTGDFLYLTAKEIAAVRGSSSNCGEKTPTCSVTILGLDARGNVIQRNARGETFYLDAKSGDMVFVK